MSMIPCDMITSLSALQVIYVILFYWYPLILRQMFFINLSRFHTSFMSLHVANRSAIFVAFSRYMKLTKISWTIISWLSPQAICLKKSWYILLDTYCKNNAIICLRVINLISLILCNYIFYVNTNLTASIILSDQTSIYCYQYRLNLFWNVYDLLTQFEFVGDGNQFLLNLLITCINIIIIILIDMWLIISLVWYFMYVFYWCEFTN